MSEGRCGGSGTLPQGGHEGTTRWACPGCEDCRGTGTEPKRCPRCQAPPGPGKIVDADGAIISCPDCHPDPVPATPDQPAQGTIIGYDRHPHAQGNRYTVDGPKGWSIGDTLAPASPPPDEGGEGRVAESNRCANCGSQNTPHGPERCVINLRAALDAAREEAAGEYEIVQAALTDAYAFIRGTGRWDEFEAQGFDPKFGGLTTFAEDRLAQAEATIERLEGERADLKYEIRRGCAAVAKGDHAEAVSRYIWALVADALVKRDTALDTLRAERDKAQKLAEFYMDDSNRTDSAPSPSTEGGDNPGPDVTPIVGSVSRGVTPPDSSPPPSDSVAEGEAVKDAFAELIGEGNRVGVKALRLYEAMKERAEQEAAALRGERDELERILHEIHLKLAARCPGEPHRTVETIDALCDRAEAAEATVERLRKAAQELVDAVQREKRSDAAPNLRSMAVKAAMTEVRAALTQSQEPRE